MLKGRKTIKNSQWDGAMGKIIAGKVSDITEGKLHKVTIDGKDILVTNFGGNFYAVDDTCTHSGDSLANGTLDGNNVVCGWHGAQFDCKSGKLVKFPGEINDLKSYNVVVESDDVFVEVS